MGRPTLKLIDKIYKGINFVPNLNFGSIRYPGITNVWYKNVKVPKNSEIGVSVKEIDVSIKKDFLLILLNCLKNIANRHKNTFFSFLVVVDLHIYLYRIVS